MIDRIRELCKKKGLSITKLEMILNFGNGSISKPKTKSMGCDRLKAIADYFDVSMEYLMTGEENKTARKISDFEYKIISAFRKADEYDQISVLRTLGVKKEDAKFTESKIG